MNSMKQPEMQRMLLNVKQLLQIVQHKHRQSVPHWKLVVPTFKTFALPVALFGKPV
jgi:hypothetical protein